MIDTDKYEGYTIKDSSWNHHLSNDADIQLIADAPLLLAEVKRLQEEVRRLRDMVCLLEDSRIRGLFIHDRPELFADVAEVHRQRKEDTHGHLPCFDEALWEE